MRQRLLDQLLQCVARVSEGLGEILHERLLVELRGGERELDGDFFSGAGLRRIAARHRELAVAGQEYR